MNAVDKDVVAAISEEIAAIVGELRYDLWFRQNTRLKLTQEGLSVGVPNLFFQEWLSSNFLPVIRKAMRKVVHRDLPVKLVVDGELFRDLRTAQPARQPEQPVSKPNTKTRPPRSTKGPCFESFVVGDSNRMAFAAASKVAESPSGDFNPLLIYGSLGLGKTHLLRSIDQKARAKLDQQQVLYLTAETFTNNFLEAMRNNALHSFRNKVRGVALLIVDDIHFFSGKRATQTELLYTFDALDMAGRQVVLSADRHPSLLVEIPSELRSRFVAGMACLVESPDFDTRVAIFQRRCLQVGLRLSAEVTEFVAARITRNVRELVGAVNSLKALATATKCPIDVAIAQRVLTNLLVDNRDQFGTCEIVREVARVFGVTVQQLQSSSRSRAISYPRMVAIYLLRKWTGSSYEAIGDYLGGRNHSTIISAEKKVINWIDGDATLQLSGRRFHVLRTIEAVERNL